MPEKACAANCATKRRRRPDCNPHGEEALLRRLEPCDPWPILRDAAKTPLLRMRLVALGCPPDDRTVNARGHCRFCGPEYCAPRLPGLRNIHPISGELTM